MKEDSSDLDDEDMDMLARKFKKFHKKVKEDSKRKNLNKSRNSDGEQFTGCFQCGKHDHIMRNCPQLKEEQEAESTRKQDRNQTGNSSGRRFSKAMLAAWGDSTAEEDETEEEEAAVALMVKSDTNLMMNLLIAWISLRTRYVVSTKQSLRNFCSL